MFNRLAAAYAEPARAYHTADHIRDCLRHFDLSRELAQQPDEVEAAIWFHDAVYDSRRSDNEERSAALARTALEESNVAPAIASRISGLILETRHTAIPHEPDPALLCDIDLSILGRSPEAFDRFEHQIRQEYAWVPEGAYRSGRSEILRGFLRRPRIYQTDWFRHRYEVHARANLERSIRELGV